MIHTSYILHISLLIKQIKQISDIKITKFYPIFKAHSFCFNLNNALHQITQTESHLSLMIEVRFVFYMVSWQITPYSRKHSTQVA